MERPVERTCAVERAVERTCAVERAVERACAVERAWAVERAVAGTTRVGWRRAYLLGGEVARERALSFCRELMLNMLVELQQ